MRELYLRNDQGLDFKLNRDVLVSSIEGLGLIRNNSYYEYENKGSLASSSSGISEITLGLIFKKGYLGYLDFVSFIKGSNSLFLHYKAVEEKYCMVAIKELSKTELSFGVLKSNLRLDKLSNWLKRIELEMDVSKSGSSKIYLYTYPYTYDATSSGRLRLTNHGHFKAEMLIKIIGLVSNPSLIIFQSGIEVATLRLLINGEGLYEISSIKNDAYIKKDGKSIYEAQDFTCINFLTLPLGESEIYFESGSSSLSKCYLVIIEEYEAN